uniref:NUC173 domain-containing protein n=1 Tax=Heterorhabditis bacteriophora TaxID=37862 RepID=A0A1I7X9F1_HETBA
MAKNRRYCMLSGIILKGFQQQNRKKAAKLCFGEAELESRRREDHKENKEYDASIKLSCESNPSKSRHRNAALSARNASFMSTSMVAVDDRASDISGTDKLLDELPLDSMNLGRNQDSRSMVSEGQLSHISSFTSCTNPAFDSVHRIWKSGSSMQTEVISVLAAVAEIIKERDVYDFAEVLTLGSETDVEYFAALLTTLEGSPLGESSRTAAIAYLLHLIVKRVPKEVLQARFSMAIQVRKNIMLNHCFSIEYITATKNGAMTTVRYLCLLEGIMHKMPSHLFKQLSETILKSFAFADPMVKCSALQCMHRCLQRQPCDAALSIETNVLLIAALRQFSPPSEDISVCAYWIQALAEAHVCLTAKDPIRLDFFLSFDYLQSVAMLLRCYNLLPPTTALIVKLFDVGNEQLAQITYQVLSRLIERCVQDHEDSAKHLLSLLDEALNLQSTSVWKFVLRTQMRLYETAGEGIVGTEFTKALQSLAQLRESDQCFCKPELDFVSFFITGFNETIGCAVRHVGAPAVLSVLPLSIDVDAVVLGTDFPRSWLIPILRVNLHNAPLTMFSTYFLPMAIKIHRRLPSLDSFPQRLYNTLQMQMWELLPSFCESPSDLEKSFPDIAPVLGAALNERKDLRLTILSALRRALRFALQPDAAPERAELMGRYAKNYMPLLFNMYTNSTVDGEYDDKSVRLSVLETIRAYTEVAPSDLICRFVNSALSKASEVGEGPVAAAKQARVLDILCALSRCADQKDLEKILDSINQWFGSNDSLGLQKKAYRILEEIMARRNSPELEALFASRIDDIHNAILRPLATIKLPARAALCACIRAAVDSFDGLSALTDFCTKSTETVVLTLDKLNSTHARANASKCLQYMCNRLIEVGSEVEEHPSTVLNPIINRIYEMATPLSGINNGAIDLEVARATLVALNIITQKLIKVLNVTHISRLISHACAWIGDGRPPVRILSIRLLRVLTQKMPDYVLHQYRDILLTSIFGGQLTCDVTVKVRKANRLLLEVLVKKFGVPVLEKYTSAPDWVKQMKNIEKINRRKERKQSEGNADEDTDDGKVSIINLSVTTTDPSILARKKAKSLENKRDKDGGFKITKNGKMIIISDDIDEKRGRKRKNGLDDLDDDMPNEDKRKREDSDAESDEYEDSDDGAGKSTVRSTMSRVSGWRPGGQGIHRNIASSSEDKNKRENGDSKKKGQKLQPYAYVPLRKKGTQKDIRKILKSQRKSGKGKSK